MTRLARFAALALALALSQAALAQDTRPPANIDLRQLMRQALRENPRLTLARQEIAGAEADRLSAGAYPNPSVSFGRSRRGGGDPTLFTGSHQDQAMFELPLLIGGQRGARIERAERELAAARARVAAGASSLAAEAGAAFVALLAAQEKEKTLAGAREDTARLQRIVAGREQAGAASRYDLARMNAELDQLDTRFADARADVADRAGQLAALLGQRDWTPRAAGKLEPLPLDASALASTPERVQATPAVMAAELDARSALGAVDVASSERTPATALNVGRSWTAAPFGAANYLGLSIEIPILDTRRGPYERALSDAEAARQRLAIAQAETAANLQRLAETIRLRQAALERYEAGTGARLPAMRQMAEDAYLLGRGSVLDLLDAVRSRLDQSQTRIDLLAALLEAQLRLIAGDGSLERRLGLAPGGS